nr:hypothetical protein CFP56_49371 [Quercus suber]
MFNERDGDGIGVIIHNSRGEVMVALFEKIQKPPTAKILELLVAKRDVRFSLETGFNKSVIEEDSESMIRSLRHGGYENSQGGHLIKEFSAGSKTLKISIENPSLSLSLCLRSSSTSGSG